MISSDFFPIIRGWCGSFLSFHSWDREAPTVSFGLRQKKHGQQLQNQARESWKPAGSCREKGKKSDGGSFLKSQ